MDTEPGAALKALESIVDEATATQSFFGAVVLQQQKIINLLLARVFQDADGTPSEAEFQRAQALAARTLLELLEPATKTARDSKSPPLDSLRRALEEAAAPMGQAPQSDDPGEQRLAEVIDLFGHKPREEP